MKATPMFSGTTMAGSLKVRDVERFKSYLLQLEGKDIEIIIRPMKFTRTIKQNNFYWAYLSIIADDTGESTERLHELFKYELIPAEKIEIFGRVLETRTTTKLDTVEFMDYIRKIEQLSGILAPDLDEIAL